MSMDYVVAVSTQWRECPRNNKASVVIQNQGHTDMYVYIGLSPPVDIFAAGYLLMRGDGTTFRDTPNGLSDRFFVRTESESANALVWR